MTDATVLITPRSFRSTEGKHKQLLARSDVEVRFPDHERSLTAEELIDLVSGCVGLIVGVDPVTEEVLSVQGLRVVVKYGSGTDNIDLTAAERQGVEVRATPGENARSVAELAAGLLLALARHIAAHDRRVREGSWKRETGTELAGKRLGLVGYGAVARAMTPIAAGLGMEVVAHDPYVTDPDIEMVTMEELLDTSDAVSLHVPLTDETHHLIGREELARLRPNAFLVNTARGGLVDEEALADALRQGTIGGAASDSFATEPAADSPLLDLERFIASPHAGAATTEATIRTGTAAVMELLDGLGMRP